MDAEGLKQNLTNHSPMRLASSLLLERIPYLFDDDWNEYRSWRAELAGLLEVDPSDVYFTGSSAVGLSLNPHKNFRSFNERSDIDLAIISPLHFDLAWRFIRSLKRSRINPQLWSTIQEHKENYIYWGCIASEKFLADLPFGASWLAALKKMSENDVTKDRSIKARIYRDAASLRSYQANNLKKIKAAVQ